MLFKTTLVFYFLYPSSLYTFTPRALASSFFNVTPFIFLYNTFPAIRLRLQNVSILFGFGFSLLLQMATF